VQLLEVAGEHADEVDDGVGTLHRATGGRRIGDARRHELGLAQSAERLQIIGVRRIALGDPHARAGLHQFLRDIAAKKAATAEQRHQGHHLSLPDSDAAPQRPSHRNASTCRAMQVRAPWPTPQVDKPATGHLKAAAYPVPRWRNW
jgi:hypothetical protein